jgi:hypothetical protein
MKFNFYRLSTVVFMFGNWPSIFARSRRNATGSKQYGPGSDVTDYSSDDILLPGTGAV